jgi:hypothetical protein
VGIKSLEDILPILGIELKMCQEQLELARNRRLWRAERPRKELTRDHAHEALLQESDFLEAEVRNINFAVAEASGPVQLRGNKNN